MQTKPKKIGEGSYGCVFKPSINCKSGTPIPPGFNNNDYISKFMKNEDAQEELNEYNKFNKIDPNDEYHLGKQFVCDPDFNLSSTMQEISTCDIIDLNDVNANPSNYKLLIGKYGGPDLKNFCDKFADSYFEKDRIHKKNKFLLEILHLLKGLKFFKDNGLVHYDLKPHNILFNLKNGSMRYIDFGLMREKNKIIEDCKLNNNWLGRSFHWSEPLDTRFMNLKEFNKAKMLTNDEIEDVAIDTYLQIISKTQSKHSKFPISKPDSFLNMFYNYLHVKNNSELQSFINDFKEFFYFAKNNSYEVVLNKTIDFIDIYGVGFTLKYLVTCLHNKTILDDKETIELNIFLKDMVHFDPLKRITDIEKLINNYNDLLVKFKIIGCGSDKEYNPRTKRCIKKCMPGYYRNSDFICKKSVTFKKNIIASAKPAFAKPVLTPVPNKPSSSNPYIYKLTDFVIKCGLEKDLNPRTNRCVKKCNPGYTRNAEFKCRKGRKTKNKYLNGGKRLNSKTRTKK